MIEINNITAPLRIAKGSHQSGSGKGCAMNVVSWMNGDTVITDFPDCSHRALARIVQSLNDGLAKADGFLSPEDAVTVIDLGTLTMGTAGTPRTVVWAWLAELLDSPDWGVIRWAQGDAVPAIHRVADLCRKAAQGFVVSDIEWRSARSAATATAYAAYADAYAAYADAYAAYADADATAYAAYATAYAAYADADARISFTRTAILRWRELAGLDTPAVDTRAVNDALTSMTSTD